MTQKLSKEAIDLTHKIEQIDLVDICRIFHAMDTEYTFFLNYLYMETSPGSTILFVAQKPKQFFLQN